MQPCDPQLRSLKSLFLGPQSENAEWLEHAWLQVLRHWVGWRRSLFPEDGLAVSAEDRRTPEFRARQAGLQGRLDELLAALERESPKFTPRYLGHMVSELSLPGVLGHAAALLHNPNQTSREVSVVTSALETEAVADLARMVGMPAARGHFTSGGTVANLEAVWRFLHRLDRTLSVALHKRAHDELPREAFRRLPNFGWDWLAENAASIPEEERRRFSLLHLGQGEFAELYRKVTGFAYYPPLVLAPDSRHYSWPKATVLTGLGRASLREVPLDEHGRLSRRGVADAFARAEREGRTVGMVVSVAGATGTGAVDPIHLVQDFLDGRREEGEEAWHHVDAAFGGYFCSLLRGPAETALAPEAAAALGAIGRAQSVTLDPHKLGFVPYSCGCFLARDEAHYRSHSFAAPYLLADNAGAWMHTLEGSRPATGVAATWLANKSIGLDADGYGRLLGLGLKAARDLVARLRERNFLVLEPVDLNIVTLSLGRPGQTLSTANRRTLACFERFRASPNFAISKTELDCAMYRTLLERNLRDTAFDAPTLVCLRLVLMNPFLTTQETNTRYLSAFLDELQAFDSEIP